MSRFSTATLPLRFSTGVYIVKGNVEIRGSITFDSSTRWSVEISRGITSVNWVLIDSGTIEFTDTDALITVWETARGEGGDGVTPLNGIYAMRIRALDAMGRHDGMIVYFNVTN